MTRPATRIGIVGCGRILAAHLRGYRLLREAGLSDFRITALCSRNPDDARSYVRRGEGPPQRTAVSDIPGDPLAVADEYLSDFQPEVAVSIHDDYRGMVAEAEIDAVNDFTSHALHHPVAVAAFEAGRHLLTQKPMAATVDQARDMCDHAEAAGVVFGVFENFRFAETTRALEWLFEDGRIGPVQSVLLGYHGVWWAPDRIVANTPWRHRKADGGGIALDLGPHFLNQLRHVCGPIESVLARTAVVQPVRRRYAKDGAVLESVACDADDTFMATVRFGSGVLANLFASWCGSGRAVTVGSGAVYQARRGQVDGSRLIDADGRERSLTDLFHAEADSALRQRWFPHGVTDSFALAQHDWLKAIAGDGRPEMDGRAGLADLAAAAAILESSETSRAVRPKA